VAKGIEIGIASETGAFEKGIQSGMIEPLEDAVDKLAELGKSRGPERLEDSLEDAQTATEKLGREVKDTAEAIEQDFRRSYRRLKESADDGTRGAIRGMDDLRDESKQSLRETAASIRDVSDGLDAVQEIAANAFIGFGPAGFLAGAAAASGIGLISSALETAQQASDELKRRIASMYQQAVEDERKFLEEAQIQSAVLDIYFDDNQDRYRQAVKDAAELGLTTEAVVRAMAGDQEALNQVIARTAQLQDAYNQKLNDSTDPIAQRSALYAAEGQTLDEITNRYQAQADIIEENQRKAEELLRTQQEQQEVIQKTNRALSETPQSIPVTIEVDRSQIDAALQRRTLRIDIEGYTRDGQRVV
jgi:hypothetical protein